nr:mucin-5AC-like [Procambarus clarkii]
MTVAVAATLTDLPLSLALLLGMDDVPDAPMRHPRPPDAPPVTTHDSATPSTSRQDTYALAEEITHDSYTLAALDAYTLAVPTTYTLAAPTSYSLAAPTTYTLAAPTTYTHAIPTTAHEAYTQVDFPKAAHDTGLDTYPEGGSHGASFSWEGVSPDPALSLYGSPGLPAPSPRPTPTPEATHSGHTQSAAQSVSVTLADLTLAAPHTCQAPPEYTSGYHDAPRGYLDTPPYRSSASPSLALLAGEDLPGSSDWSSISGATVGLEGWGADPLQHVWPSPSWPPQQDPWTLQVSAAGHPAALSPASREVAQGLPQGAPTARRSASRSPLSPPAPSPGGRSPLAPPLPSPGGRSPRSPLAPSSGGRSPLAPPPPSPGGGARSPRDTRQAERRRWRRRQEEQTGAEEGEWRGRGSGWRRWLPRRAHSLVLMEGEGGAAAESGGTGTPRASPTAPPHTPTRHHTPHDADDADDDDAPVCVPPGESPRFEMFDHARAVALRPV